jgi:hypothetical protein
LTCNDSTIADQAVRPAVKEHNGTDRLTVGFLHETRQPVNHDHPCGVGLALQAASKRVHHGQPQVASGAGRVPRPADLPIRGYHGLADP